ncbi:MAG: hypothetical protein CBB70_11515 [Planctomycetaceae bacterium TMED10]|nr:MAG: hypothetical protein CBB70_11515 [Planctomycetaceae bacterium TMED10]
MPLLSIDDHFANLIFLNLTAHSAAPRCNVSDPLPIASRDVYSGNWLQCNFFLRKTGPLQLFLNTQWRQVNE